MKMADDEAPAQNTEEPEVKQGPSVKDRVIRFNRAARSYAVVMSGRIHSKEKYSSSVVKILGMVAVLLGAILFLMGAFAWASGEDYMMFLTPAPFFFFPGMLMYMFFRYAPMSAAVGILLISETWILCFVAAIIPFYLSGINLIDSIYEGISGFTTTGSSMFSMSSFDTTTKSILLWRSVTEWVGGITVVIVFAFLLPMIGMGGRNLGSNEFGGNSSEYSQDIKSSALAFVRMYAFLTIVESFILMFLGLIGIDNDTLSPFNSVCIAMSNVSTGGLLPFPDSMASMSFPTQFVTLIFMILGASNFFLMIRSINRRRFELGRSREWRMMLIWFAVCAAFISADVIYNSTAGEDYLGDIWRSVYAVTSAGTSAGFAVSDYMSWPQVALVVLLVVQFVGGCSGSTAGGIKVHRLMAIKAYIMAGMDKIMHPGAVSVLEVDGSRIDTDQATSVLSTVLLFLLAFITGVVLILLLENAEIIDSLLLTVSAVSNAGAVVGTGTLDFELSSVSKILLCFLMYLGRMEMVYILMMFTPRFWSEVIQGTRRGGKYVRQRSR